MSPEIIAAIAAHKLAGTAEDINIRAIANKHGNADDKTNLLEGLFVHISGSNATLRCYCRNHHIPWLNYRSGWHRWRRYFTPLFNGIVVRADHAEMIRDYLNPAQARNKTALQLWAERQHNPERSLDPEEDERLYA